MTLHISKSAIDIGIVTRQPGAMMAFYQDALGLELEAVVDMPGGGLMNRLRAGDSIVKIIELDPPPAVDAEVGGIRAATGLRYLTIQVSNLEEAVAAIETAGHRIALQPRKMREGVFIAIVDDPDGNSIELVQYRS